LIFGFFCQGSIIVRLFAHSAIPEMTCAVSGRTLNPTHSLAHCTYGV